MKKVAIIGASSLTGQKLIELLSKHTQAKVSLATSNTFIGVDVPNTGLKYEAFDIDKVEGIDVLFSCLPHTRSMSILPLLTSKVGLIIDLSADFRTPYKSYENWYQTSHKAKELTPAVYGLSEVFEGSIKNAKFIANPGCYPTASLLALTPLLKNGYSLYDVGIIGLSGRSGAGRQKAKEYEKKEEQIEPYKDQYAYSHQHIGEIEYIADSIAGKNKEKAFKLYFMQTNIIYKLYQGMRVSVIAKCDIENEDTLLSIYEEYYYNQPFVEVKKIVGAGEISLKSVENTNKCLLGLSFDKDNNRLYISSVIDNLIKGASGQAIQNMNITLGFDQTLGLEETQ